MLHNQVSLLVREFSECYFLVHNLAIFLLDAHYEVFIWFGWWWKEDKGDENSVTATANSQTTGSLISRWLRDKQLALETAQQYAKGTTHAIKTLVEILLQLLDCLISGAILAET